VAFFVVIQGFFLQGLAFAKQCTGQQLTLPFMTNYEIEKPGDV